MDMRSKRRGISVVLAGMGLIAAGQDLRADTVDLPAVQDAALFGGTANVSNSLADPGMFVGTDTQDNPKRGLVEFDIADNVPAGATITNVQLNLTVGWTALSTSMFTPLSNSVTISLFDVPQSWGQPTNVIGATTFVGMGQGAGAATGDATWNDRFFSSTLWTTAGGDWTSGPLGSTDLADASGTGATALMTWSSTALIGEVQNWLNNPSSNNGLLLKNSNETTAKDYLAFWSAQGAKAETGMSNSSIAPELIVTYTPVPEPSAVLLLAGALPMLLRRRRGGKERIS